MLIVDHAELSAPDASPEDDAGMLQMIAEFIVESGFRVVGWAVLKLVTLNGYSGRRDKNEWLEISVGLATFAAASFAVYLF